MFFRKQPQLRYFVRMNSFRFPFTEAFQAFLKNISP